MAQAWLARRDDDLDDIDAWMARRNADLALRPDADATAHDLWNQATRTGDDVQAARPSDLTAIGLAALNGNGAADDGSPGPAPAPPAGLATDADDQADPPTQDNPGYRTVTARPGDSISRLMGTSRPEAIGRFVAVNGLKTSALSVGRQYVVPTSYDEATRDEIAIGDHILRSDNARLADARSPAAGRTAADVFSQRLNAGLNVWTGQEPDTAAPRSTVPPPNDRSSWNPVVQRASGAIGYVAGVPLGVARAAVNAAEGVYDTGKFGLELSGALGSEAQSQASGEAADAAHSALQYGRAAIDDPSKVVSDLRDGSEAAIDSVVPSDLPMSGTSKDAFFYGLRKGSNLGEAGANVLGLLAGGEVAEGAAAAKAFGATRAANIAKFVEQGASPRVAEYLAQPYDGMGHHAAFPRRTKIPSSILGIPVADSLAGQPLPSWISDSWLNVSKPPGMSRGDFYEYHYAVDPMFHGARLPADLSGGKGWSGKRLGLSRYNAVQRTWYGTPLPVRGAIAAIPAGEAPNVLASPDQGGPQ